MQISLRNNNHRPPKPRLLLIWLLAGWVLAAGAAAPQTPPPFRIVTSFYPMQIAALNIVRNVPGVELRNMAPPTTGCLHDYQLTAADLVALRGASAFVVNGAGMETFLDKALRQIPALRVIEASRGIPLPPDPAGGNAHVWVSPALYIRQVRNIAAGLAEADPAHAAQYRANGEEYVKKIAALQARMRAGLAELAARDIITFHEAFSCFAQEFNLNPVAVIEREPGSEPGAGELARTIRIVREKKVRALFAEPQYPARAADTIARETGAKVYLLDPVVSGPAEPDAWLRAMETNLATLQSALR